MSRISIFFKQNIYLFLLMILIFPSYMSLIRPGFYSMHDDLQAFRIHQMHQCFKDLQLPCRWVPDAGYQYGYPLFNYYPPSAYYLGEVFHLVGFQYIDSVKLVFIFGFITSALAMYLLIRALVGDFSALIGSLMYTYAPYKAVDVYVRGAMSEFMALIFFPLIFWSTFKLITDRKKRYLIYTALSIAGILLTHNLMTMIFIPVLMVWCLLWLYVIPYIEAKGNLRLIIKNSWSRILILILGGILGIGLAAFFSLPVIFEKQYAHIESLTGGYFDYRLHFVNLEQLFISNFWDYGSSVWGDSDEISLSTGQLHALMGGLAVIFSLILFKRHKKLAMLIIFLAVVELGVLFMMHQRSSFIWDKVPVFSLLQFPWRFMALSIFLLSLLTGIFMKYMDNSSIKYLFGIFLIGCVLMLYLGFFKPEGWINISDEEKFSGKSWDKQLTISIFDYLPIYAELPPITRAPEKPEIMEGKAEVYEYKKGSNYQIGKVKVVEDVNLRLPLFDFPGMVVTINGEKIEHWHNDCRGQQFCLGLISFRLAPGNYEIKAQLKDTPVRMIGNVLSMISLILIFVLMFKDKIIINNRKR